MLKRSLVFWVALMALAGCGPGQTGAEEKVLELTPFRDPWKKARPRMLDIGDRPYLDLVSKGYSYSTARVRLFYPATMPGRFFSGRLEAEGLKPFFAYQLKLAGVPAGGARGWGQAGDEISNARIGKATRWWCDTCQANVRDTHYAAYGPRARASHRHTVYGYQFIGTFVTDAAGQARFEFKGDRALHITWRGNQKGHKHIPLGTFTLPEGEPPFYGYGKPMTPRNMNLWYEWEAGRRRQVQLPSGDYRARFLVTEESFHAGFGKYRPAGGGFWLTVLASEDAGSGGQPDQAPENDLRFTIP